MSYTHDVFLSYAHCFEDWIEDCFVPELTQYLSQELNPRMRIFLSIVQAFIRGMHGELASKRS